MPAIRSPLNGKQTLKQEDIREMPADTPSITQLSQVIAQVTGPSFLLGAVAAFISVLISRMNRIIDRSQALNAISDEDNSKAHVKADIPRLKRRAALLNRAILFSTISAIVTSLLVIVAFVCAFYDLRHEYGVALLFVVALCFFTISLINLAREARIALHEFDHYSS
jgi:cytochrome bd-type quinol oxidase subunit 2